MKRNLLAAIAAFVTLATGIGIFQVQNHGVGDAHAENAPPALAAAPSGQPQPEATVVDQDAPYFEACAREGLNESECVGRLIWFKATGGNERFHTYTFQQRIGVLVDWFRVLRADQRDDRFWAWGIINDPACCKPGDPDCPAKSADETYGFDWCPGDDVLLKYVGKPGYVDPACGLKDAALDPDDPHSQGGKADQRHSACDLKFGTSTGALGIRKFPNPRFDAAKWKALNGGNGHLGRLRRNQGRRHRHRIRHPGQQAGRRLDRAALPDRHLLRLLPHRLRPAQPAGRPGAPEVGKHQGPGRQPIHPHVRTARLRHAEEQPRIPDVRPRPARRDRHLGHLARPDQQPRHHQRADQCRPAPGLQGRGGHQVAQGATCGAEKDEGQVLVRTRPQRQVLAEEHARRRRDDGFPRRPEGRLPGVHHILKGGEDSIGALEAIQRVYFNIGSCSEQCWVNHFTDMRQLDPEQRGFGQTPFNVGQCRRDCPNFRAVEDRLQNILDFFASAESDETDLHVARANAQGKTRPPIRRADLIADLDKEFGKGAVGRGQTVFADNCARCHSSIPESAGGAFKNRDFAAPNDAHPRKVRADFLGNDQADAGHRGRHLPLPLPALQPQGRPPLHGIRFRSHAAQAAVVADIPERDELKDGGRGYMRNISLVNVWATAPFMHNNAIGPEICGKPANKDNDFHRARYVDPTASCSPASPTACATTRRWTAASSSTSVRCTNC
jgi:hypothetical protein